ncbi:hypothetical protein HHI36_011309 [Cryptolaemus montrouzieri]|uniref:Uncharacterized protein n=1 Tax=Cryptolaemus montrouzieri TaxID=559131 RepID=A0ABD2MLB0_9CUCU
MEETGLKEQFVKVNKDTKEKFKVHEEGIEKLDDKNRKLRDQLSNLIKKQRKNNWIIHGASLENENPGETAKREEILKNAYTLKGSGYYVTKDLSPEQRSKQQLLIKYMRDARNKR